jgi:hypothetical protein
MRNIINMLSAIANFEPAFRSENKAIPMGKKSGYKDRNGGKGRMSTGRVLWDSKRKGTYIRVRDGALPGHG